MQLLISDQTLQDYLSKQNPKDSQKKFTKLLLLRVPLRLGFDVFKSQEISEKKAKSFAV